MVRFEVDDRGLDKIVCGVKEVEEHIRRHAKSPIASS